MKTITVGAFDAKTHLSQLLDHVEDGAEVKITRRGKLVAVLRGVREDEADSAKRALQRLVAHQTDVGAGEIRSLIDEGRKA